MVELRVTFGTKLQEYLHHTFTTVLFLAFSSSFHFLQAHAWNVEEYQRHQASRLIPF